MVGYYRWGLAKLLTDILVKGNTIFIGKSRNYQTMKDRLSNFNLLILIFCLLLILHIPLMVYMYNIPIALLYGPMLLACLWNLKDQKVNFSTILLHFLPFFVFSTWYIILVDDIKKSQLLLLYMAYIVSLIAYPTYVLRNTGKVRGISKRHKAVLLDILCFFGYIVSFFLLTMVFYLFKPFVYDVKPVYVFMVINVIGIFIILVFLTSRFAVDIRRTYYNVLSPQKVEPIKISDQDWIAYHQIIKHAMEKDKLFLDSNLHMEKFLQLTGLPKEVMVEFLDRQVKCSFVEWLAKYRILYAVSLLRGNYRDIKTNILSNICGFNSISKFHKYFQLYMRQSVSDFKNKQS